MRRFMHKVAVVTGAASGIGAATAQEFAAEGACVALLDIDEAGARRTATAMHTSEALVECVDVSDSGACQSVVETIVGRWNRIDCLVNSAASFIAEGLGVSEGDWERSLGVNVRGYGNMVQAATSHMKPGSAIVNVSSVSAHVAQGDRWTYNASKGASNALSRCQALDLSDLGIRVNIVSPVWIWTPEVERAAAGERDAREAAWSRFYMLRRLGEPREVARAILFL
jgi:NAD(P)-dependent dehydrogenase (short-subunit alcohol dehydrogenase family)